MTRDRRQRGFTKVDNVMLEALAQIRIPGEARKVLDVIQRKTWGFHKDEDQISLSQFTRFTGLAKPNVIRARRKLLEMNIINMRSPRDSGTIGGSLKICAYSINRDAASWEPITRGGIKNDNRGVSKAIPTKETLTKENIERKSNLKPKDTDSTDGDFDWLIRAINLLNCEFIGFRKAVRSRYGGDIHRLAHQLLKIAGCSSYVVFTAGRFYRKFRGTDTLRDPLAYLHTMLKPERAVYDCGDGLFWNEHGTAEEYYQTFFEEDG